MALGDPLESALQDQAVWLVPANATLDRPLDVPLQNPESAVKFVNVYDGEAWKLVEDHRTTLYWLAGDAHSTEPRAITDLGSLPEGALLERPAKTQDELAAELRTFRDGIIASHRWLIERHNDELAAGMGTTLNADTFKTWLSFIQALRAMPQAKGFPWDGGGDQTPWPKRPS